MGSTVGRVDLLAAAHPFCAFHLKQSGVGKPSMFELMNGVGWSSHVVLMAGRLISSLSAPIVEVRAAEVAELARAGLLLFLLVLAIVDLTHPQPTLHYIFYL